MQITLYVINTLLIKLKQLQFFTNLRDKALNAIRGYQSPAGFQTFRYKKQYSSGI